MFRVYCGKCLSHIAVHSWGEKRGTSFADDDEFGTEVRKWLRKHSKDFYATRCDAVVK
jgi:hypothetical protein